MAEDDYADLFRGEEPVAEVTPAPPVEKMRMLVKPTHAPQAESRWQRLSSVVAD